MAQAKIEPEAAVSQAPAAPPPHRSRSQALGRWIGGIVGALLLAGGIAAVLLVDWNPIPPPPAEIVRPVKFAVAVDPAARPERRFRGQVLAGRTVDMAFQVGGPLVEVDLALGRRVTAGQVLARIDPTRFEHQVAILRPQFEQAQVNLNRFRQLAATGSASATELTNAQAAFDSAAAQLKVAEQALADTVLRAPTDGLIVARSVENFQNVTPGAPVLRLQDISHLDIAVDLPESLVALHDPSRPSQAQVVFPVRPEKAYPVQVREASAEADPQTGTYRVIFTMPAPTELTLLPGMAATLLLPSRSGSDARRVSVPLAALFADSQGRPMVWRLDPDGDAFRVEATPVRVAETWDDAVLIDQGLEAGNRVATAGVGFLRQHQRVVLMETRP